MADEEQLDEHLDLHGTHAFLFIDHVAESTTPEEVVGRIRALGMPRVLYASAFVGEFHAFAHLRVEEEGLEGIGKLQDLIETQIIPTGARCSYAVETMIQPLGAKRKSPGLIVLTRIKLAPGANIDDERERLINERPDGFVGISLMSGDWDVLLQTTGDSVDQAYEFTRAIVTGLGEVQRTSTSFASGDRTQERYGNLPFIQQSSEG
jgi:DNA-binding Lrp family transcriptional regulator